MDLIISGVLMGSSLVGVVIVSLFIRFGCCSCRECCSCIKKKEKYEIDYDEI
jgi:hypothetical protein